MYNLSQFKPSLYALLLLGMLGFGLASESPGVWAMGTGGILLNAWLVKTGRFTPMPRLMANVVTIGSMLYVAREVFAAGTTPVMVIGKFLVLLQLIKLWEQRANRDYAQLIVLSLLLMVAASISTTSLIFAVLLLAFLFLALYCCLLFHLKVESDRAREAFPLPPNRMSPATLRQDERFLGRSMRRLTGFVSAVSIAAAVVVFLLFPRGAGAGMFGPMPFRPAQALTGFSDTLSFQNLAQITQNQAQVAKVEVWHNDRPVSGDEPLLLRGVTFDHYETEEDRETGRYAWTPTPTLGEVVEHVERGESWRFAEHLAPGGDQFRQRITLYPTGTPVVFAMGGAVSIKPGRNIKLRYHRGNAVLKADDNLTKELVYEAVSTNRLPGPARPRSFRRSAVDPAILRYARDPAVSGTAADGEPLVAKRFNQAYVHELDEQIARNIERHLQTQFTYTLDLTDARHLTRDDDPLVAFLTTLKRGHCEYFAGAMALMCQGLGMRARVVNGFKSDEFNDVGFGTGYYIVRQSHAHSWVEVLTVDDPATGAASWKTFDPTSGRDDGEGDAGMWVKMKHLFDFIEFTYANAVIGYDSDNRDTLLAGVEQRVQSTGSRGSAKLASLRAWLGSNVWSLSSNVVGVIVALMAVALAGFVAWHLWDRRTVRRKAARIGLEGLSPAARARLVRQLGFYDDLVRLLGRHHIVRPRHLTPLEFSRTLTHLPSEAYGTIRRLTQVFYRVRYGRAELTGGRQRRLGAVISRLEGALGTPNASPPNAARA
jgi:Ca2+/Na+ antiporter